MRFFVKSIVLPILTVSAIAFAQAGDLKSANSKAASSAETSMAMTSVAPLFIENETFSSAVHLVNEAQSGGWMEITVFDLDGNQVASVPEYFDPVSERTFQVKDLLRSSGVIVAAGSLQFMPASAAQPIAILGQVSMTHYQAGTYAYLDEEFSMPQYGASSVLRAVAEGSRAYTVIALTNTTPRPLSSSVVCTGSSAAQVTRSILLKPFQTMLLRPCTQGDQARDVRLSDLEAIPAGGSDPEKIEALGISINTSGTPGDLVTYGLVSRAAQSGLDLGSVEFIDPAPLRSSGLVFTGVPIGYTALLNKTYDGHIGVVNFTNKPAHVSVLFAKSKNDDGSVTTVDQFTLPPASSKLLKLTGVEGDVNMLNSFIIRSDVEPGGVLSKVVSRVQDSSYRAETPAKDENQINNSGGHPWTVADGMTSTLFLFNHDSKAQTVTVRIGTKKGDWRKAYPIRPMQTLSIDIGSLVQQRVKDDENKTLPEDMVTGEIGWVAPEPHLSGRLLQSDNTIGMARNFSCGQTQYLCGLGDGILEASDAQDNDFGAAGLQKCISSNATAPLPTLAANILTAVAAWGKQQDDQTLLLVRCIALS